MKKLGFGFMRLPMPDPKEQGRVDFDQVCRMVDTFLAHGFTYFDTAYMYHEYQSECVLRRALVERHPRGSFTVATKLPVMALKDAAQQERVFAEQLQKCGVDYFDYYLLHNLNVSNYETAKRLDSFAFLSEKKAQGRARRIGFSFHDRAQLLDEILTAHPEVDFVQLQINYLDWENESIQSRRCYEVACRHNKPVIVMEPVKGGTLAHVPEGIRSLFSAARPDLSPPAWAIRFAASLDNVLVVLSGMSDLAQMEDNISFMEDFSPMTARERIVVERAAELLRGGGAVPCTACRYCVEGCPKHIPIPEYFALLNAERQEIEKDFSVQGVYYANLAAAGGRASDCIGCGKCERACPQHIEVPRFLKDVAAAFEKEGGN